MASPVRVKDNPRKTYVFAFCLVILSQAVGTAKAQGQASDGPFDFMKDSGMVVRLNNALAGMYNLDFGKARKVLRQLRQQYPDHPVTPFFEALIDYWADYPMMPEKRGSRKFERELHRSWNLAEARLREDPTDTEAVFFNLTARSFTVMYYADNGKPRRAISHIATIYSEILKGMKMKDSFREFYFLVGLYNYYIEAWPAAYPVYRPVTMFLKDGDRQSGLNMLQWASRHTVFQGAEASMFLALIYLNFEHDYDSARAVAGRLHGRYPNNPFYLAKYAEILLISGDPGKALPLIDELSEMDPFSRMKAAIFRGMYEERARGDLDRAAVLFRKGLELSENFGPLADHTAAHAYIGLSRYFEWKGEHRKARYYEKKARQSTGYDYVFESPGSQPARSLHTQK